MHTELFAGSSLSRRTLTMRWLMAQLLFPRWLALALVFSACTMGENKAIEWYHYSPTVLNQAETDGRPVILNFHADWCSPCLKLDEFTFSDERVIESTKSFLMMKVDITDYESADAQNIREQFGVTGVPEIIFLNRAGNEVQGTRVIGYLGAEKFLRLLKSVNSIFQKVP